LGLALASSERSNLVSLSLEAAEGEEYKQVSNTIPSDRSLLNSSCKINNINSNSWVVVLPFLVVAVAEVVRDVAWHKIFRLATSLKGMYKDRDQDRDKPVQEVEGAGSMLKLASSFRMAINEREMMLPIQVTVVTGRGLEEGEVEIEQRCRFKAYKISRPRVVVTLFLIARVYSGPLLLFCSYVSSFRLFHHSSAGSFWFSFIFQSRKGTEAWQR
jgi:hypothetical protein